MLPDCFWGEMFPWEGLVLVRHRMHQWCGLSPAEICHCSADTSLLAAKFPSPVVLQCPWILNCEGLCFFFPLWLLTDVHAGALQVAETGLLLPACGADVEPGVASPWSMPCALGGAPWCQLPELLWSCCSLPGEDELIIPGFGGS